MAERRNKSASAVERLGRGAEFVQQLGNVGSFSFFAKSRWLAFFNASILHVIMLPLLGLALSVDAVVAWVNFIKSANKTIYGLTAALVSSLGALGALISIIGGLLAEFVFHTTFSLGIWFFLAGVVLGGVHSIGVFVLDLLRAYYAPENSVEKASLLQQCVRDGLTVLLLAALTGAVIFALISPAGPIYAMVMSMTVVGLTALNFVWSWLLPSTIKQGVKSFFGLLKPLENKEVIGHTTKLRSLGSKQAHPQPGVTSTALCSSSRGRLFYRVYRNNEVKKRYLNYGAVQAKSYLLCEIDSKLKALRSAVKVTTDLNSIDKSYDCESEDLKDYSQLAIKQRDKVGALLAAKALLNGKGKYNSVDELIDSADFPAHAQSFFSTISDTTDLLLAIKYFMDKVGDDKVTDNESLKVSGMG